MISVAVVLISGATSEAADAFNRKYSDIQNDLRILARKHRGVRLFSIGRNDTGEKIQGIKVGYGPVRTLVVGTHHGNEYGATEVARAFAFSVAASPIPGQTVYVIPVLNVSGYDKRERQELGRDPNRDYPGPCGTGGPWKLRSTKALADFVERAGIVSTATLHTHSPFVLYPWGFSTKDTQTEYDDLYIDLARSAAVESGYPVGNSTIELYPADGCFEDYTMWKYGVWSLLFEMGSTHRPNQSQIDEMIRGNVPGLRRFLAQAPSKRAEKHAFTGVCDLDKSGPRRTDE